MISIGKGGVKPIAAGRHRSHPSSENRFLNLKKDRRMAMPRTSSEGLEHANHASRSMMQEKLLLQVGIECECLEIS